MLMVAYYFPPVGGIGSIRAMKFAQYLPASGWEPTVLAPSGTSQPRDDSLMFDETRVVRARSVEISRLGKKAAAAFSPVGVAADGRGHSALRRFAHRFLYNPDAQVGWYPFAVRAGRRALAARRFDAIFSSSVPITAHLVARRLHRDSGIPWVAEFRDLWADFAPDGRTSMRRDRLERAILREAAAVVTVSPSWGRRLAEKGAARLVVLTNGFDPADIEVIPPIREFVVTHLGSLDPTLQDLGPVWTALGMMRTIDPGLPLRIRFVGDLASPVRAQIASAGLGDVLEVTGFVPQRAALAMTMASSVLIVAGFHREHPRYQGWVPAKLFEYLGTGLPILYLGASNTDAARILSGQPACHVIEPGDVDGTLRALRAAREQGRVQRDLAPYTRQALAERLAEVLESVRQ